jgi:pre-mRNA branch site protein p14
MAVTTSALLIQLALAVLYHQPEKMHKSKEDIEARRESLAQLKKQHGID